MKHIFRLLLACAMLACACTASAEEADASFYGAATASQAEGVVVTISAAGDVIIGADVRKEKNVFEEELARQGGDLTFPWRNVRDLLLADDLTIVNLECALTDAPIAADRMSHSYVFAAPPSYAVTFVGSGVEAVALENNHVMDHGEQGYADTCAALDGVGVLYSGHLGPCVYTTASGVRVGMLSYQTFDGRYADIYEQMPGDIEALRAQGCQIVVVSYHWGDENEYTPNARQVPLGRATVDAGADLVLGHHSHRINPIELYEGKYICYSLANFSFAGNVRPSDRDTFIFQLRLRVLPDGTVENEDMRIVPCCVSSVEGYSDFIPTPYGPEDAARVAQRLVELGDGLEYALDAYPLEWDRGLSD